MHIVVSFLLGAGAADYSAPQSVVIALILGLALRLLLLFTAFGRHLRPILDLPLLGLVFAATGSRQSPLDPALFLIYTLLIFYLEPEPHRRLAWGYYWSFLAGFLGMYGILLLTVRHEQAVEWTRLCSEVDAQADEYRKSVPDALYRAGGLAVAAADWTDQAGDLRLDASAVAVREQFLRDLKRYQDMLDESSALLEQLAPRLSSQADSEAALSAGLARFWQLDGRMTDHVGVLGQSLESLSAALVEDPAGQTWVRQGLELLDDLVVRTTRLRDLATRFTKFLDVNLRGLRDNRDAFREQIARLVMERFAVAILVMATLSLLAGLRYRYEEEVQTREAARSDLELQQRTQETENWIALTAGLTHSIGNDILAYDAYAEEALDAIDLQPDAVPAVVTHNLRFIHETNRARMSFIKFLDEFARTRKAKLEGLKEGGPRDLHQIEVETLLRVTRKQVGDVEAADLPRESRDKAVKEQIRKLTELPLEVEFADEKSRTIGGARRGILQFFFYELIKNAIRNCSGTEPIRVQVQKRDERVILRFINDLAVAPVADDRVVQRYRLPRYPDMQPCTDEELRLRVQEILAQCFEPGRGGGTGLGLFLIRYFVREYYRGSVSARLFDWSHHLVAFELEIPDDLSAAWSSPS